MKSPSEDTESLDQEYLITLTILLPETNSS